MIVTACHITGGNYISLEPDIILMFSRNISNVGPRICSITLQPLLQSQLFAQQLLTYFANYRPNFASYWQSQGLGMRIIVTHLERW